MQCQRWPLRTFSGVCRDFKKTDINLTPVSRFARDHSLPAHFTIGGRVKIPGWAGFLSQEQWSGHCHIESAFYQTCHFQRYLCALIDKEDPEFYIYIGRYVCFLPWIIRGMNVLCLSWFSVSCQKPFFIVTAIVCKVTCLRRSSSGQHCFISVTHWKLFW